MINHLLNRAVRHVHYNNLMLIVVVGAGTAGISTVGALVQEGFSNITWIDPEFEGGAMKTYDGIPSNTKAKNLSKYAQHLPLFSKYDKPQTTVDVFARLEPQKQTTLNQLKECLDRMTRILRDDFGDQVKLIKASMTKLVQLENGTFEVHTDSNVNPIVRADLVYLCLGGQLKTVPNQPHLKRLNAYDIMSEKKVENYDLSNDVVEVYGSSHSAVLCLRNLSRMQKPPKKIYHIMNKKQLTHAQYVGDFIRHDTVGLKGVASEFGKQYESGKHKDYIVTQYTWDNTVNEDTTKVIEAVGFKPRDFLFESKEGVKQCKAKQGYLYLKQQKVPNLHLIGLMSPQYFVDQEGQRMPAVGVDKFLCYVLTTFTDFKKTNC